MKPFLVHLHIYYTEMWAELRDKLDSISSYPYDLYVTLVQENRILQDSILTYKKDAHIEVIENRGFDVGPFVHVINQVDLDDYSYIVKLHTKRNIDDKGIHVNHFSMYGTKWKNYLLEFLSSKEVFIKHLRFLENNKKIGMIAPFQILVNSSSFSKKTSKLMGSFYKEHNLDNINYRFVAGTMFLANANIFRALQNLHLNLEEFEEANIEKRDRQLAHIIERVIGLLVYSQGYEIKDVFTPKACQIVSNSRVGIKNFFYQSHITKSGRHIIKFCKVPIYWRKTK